MLPKVPKVTNKSGTLGSICSLLICRMILHIKSEQMLPKVLDLFVTFGILGSICLLLICLSSTSESVNADRCIFSLNFAGLRSRKIHIESKLCSVNYLSISPLISMEKCNKMEEECTPEVTFSQLAIIKFLGLLYEKGNCSTLATSKILEINQNLM